MTDLNRKLLAAQQTALLAALTAGQAPPEGFDESRVRLTARTLITKRRMAIARSWPALAESLGDLFAAKFTAYAQSHSMPEAGHAADGRAFAEHLLALYELPEPGRIMLMLDRARTGFPIQRMRLPQRNHWAIALRIRQKTRWCILPL